MKKMIFSAVAFAVVAVSAVAVAPTTSEAIPAFARQTGAACLSCHYQSFPTLTSFGRSFKQGAFTDVGEQALIEDDAMSIPSVLNATVVFRPQIVTSKTTGLPAAKSISYGDQVVLIGGRIGANAGAFVELGGGAFGNHQMATSFDVGGVKAGVSYYNTGFGENAGMQLQNSWGQHGGMMNMRFTSGNQNMFATNALGTKQIAGLTAHVITDMVTVQAGLIAPSLDAATFGGGAFGTTWTAAKLVRADGFFDLGGMNLGAGAMFITGNVGDLTNAAAAALPAQLEMKRWGIDAQLEGEFGDASFGVYADYASAGSSSAAKFNMYNASLVDSRNAWGVHATVKPLHNLVIGAGIGQDKTGPAKTDLTNVAAEFEIYQNFVIAVLYEISKPNLGGAKTTTTTVDIEALM